MRHPDPHETGSRQEAVRDVESELFDAFAAAGLVKPCVHVPADQIHVPSALADPRRLLQRIEELEEVAPQDSLQQGGPSARVTRPQHRQAAGEDTGGNLLFGFIEPENDGDGQPGAGDSNFRLPAPTRERFATMVEVVRRAYLDVRGGWSTDRVLADPALADEFLRRCWELGAQASAFELNWTLMYGRKNNKFLGVPRAERFSMPRQKLDEFGFASEMAVRHIQERQWGLYARDVSLDKIICDPVLAEELDQLAARIAPGHSPLEYRWAALTLRKARRKLGTGLRLRADGFESLGYTAQVRASLVPRSPGVYGFWLGERAVYIGQTESLRRQVSIHFDCAGTRVVPNWLDGRDYSRLRLCVAPIAGSSSSGRELLKAGQVLAQRPRFNVMPGPQLFAA